MAEGLQYWDKMVAQARGERVEHLTNEEVYHLGARAVVLAVNALELGTAQASGQPSRFIDMMLRPPSVDSEVSTISKSYPEIGSIKLWRLPSGARWATAEGGPTQDGPISMLLKPAEEVTIMDAERVAVVANTAFALLEHYHGENLTNYYINSLAELEE